jgi:transposase-like protein
MINNDLRCLWEQRLAEYENSGKTIKAWCQEQAVRENQFYYWRKKLRDQSEMGKPVKWLSVKLDNSKQDSLASDSIAVHIGQVKVEIKKGFDQQLFREIVQILQTI